MFLAHFSKSGLEEILDWTISKIAFWYEESLNLHNKLNPKEAD